MRQIQKITTFQYFIKFMLSCSVCTSSLLANIAEDEGKIQQISDLRTCLDTFRNIMHEQIQTADPVTLEHAQSAVSQFFASTNHWEANPVDLSTVSWDLYAKLVTAYHLLKNVQIGRDEHFTKYGFKQGVIEEELNKQIIDAFQIAKKIPFFREDCDPNYLSSQQHQVDIVVEEILNQNHAFHMLEDLQKESLKPVLLSLKKQVEECLGSAWRVLTIRSLNSFPTSVEFGPVTWHRDDIPPAVYKIMYYPFGSDDAHGGFDIKLQTGSQHAVEGPPGTWVLFKNSALHPGRIPQEAEQLAIEITLTPSLQYDLRPIAAGQNAKHPHLPWGKEFSSGHPLYPKGRIKGVNVGGGTGWHCNKWINLEEVHSSNNPTPFILYPNCRFPFLNESIPTVYTSHAMEHLNLATAYRVLSESQRILEEGGNLIIKIPDYDKALDCWRRQDSSFFGPEWGIGNITYTWGAAGLCDCLDYRAAMIFCSFSNNAFGNPFAREANASGSDQPYFGPAIVNIDFLRDLIKDHTPSQIVQVLRLAIIKKESNYSFCHQSAWSREELLDLLNEYGFDVVSFDPDTVCETFAGITGMHQMKDISMFCWARKRTSKSPKLSLFRAEM